MNNQHNPPPRIAKPVGRRDDDPATAAIPTAPPTQPVRAQPVQPKPVQPKPVQSPPVSAPPIVLRRARPTVFIPPEPDEGKVIAREFGLVSGLSKQPELSRNRKIAGNLPAWDPLPPGEIRVAPRRPSGGF